MKAYIVHNDMDEPRLLLEFEDTDAETGEEWSYTDIVAPSGHRVRCGCDDDQDRCDAVMIAALRTIAPELLAVAEAAERMRDSYGVAGYVESALDALDAKLREVLR